VEWVDRVALAVLIVALAGMIWFILARAEQRRIE